MGIILSKVRIQNYRSIDSLTLSLSLTNLLIGQNNAGKTNFLKALNLAVLGTADISKEDIFIVQGEQLVQTKKAVIDIMLQPIDQNGKIQSDFSEFWTSVFTDAWITTENEGNFVGIRTEIKFDQNKDCYAVSRYCIRQWGNAIDDASIETKKTYFSEDMRNYLQSYYMDANRDIVQDLRNRNSYFGRVTSIFDLSQQTVEEIEEQLSIANAKIIKSIPSLQQTQNQIALIGQTIGAANSNVEIEPLARKITDLNKGMDIILQEGNAASFPIAQHGYGTRSWISFLTLSAFVENQNLKLKMKDEAEQYFLLTLEEPEAHLHPHAQRQLFEQISKFPGQKVISTHSPSIIAQSALTNVIYFTKKDGKTKPIRYKVDNSHTDEAQIFREVINTRADLLFASAIVLCEGITEELALPVYFKSLFGCAPHSLGVSIINVCGKNKYKVFLSLIETFDIPWFILSDGEPAAINSVNSALKSVLNVDDHNLLKNVFVLGNGDDYEKHLVHSGYSDIMISTICQHEEKEDYFDNYVKTMDGKEGKKGVIRNYKHADGRTEALIDLCHEKKTEYAIPMATRICEQENHNERFPPKVKELLSAIASTLGASSTLYVED